MVKILRILIAAPFILIGAIPAFIAAVSFLVAYRIMTIGKAHEDSSKGFDVKGLMGMLGGIENREELMCDEDRPE